MGDAWSGRCTYVEDHQHAVHCRMAKNNNSVIYMYSYSSYCLHKDYALENLNSVCHRSPPIHSIPRI